MKPYKGGKTSTVFYLPRSIADVIPPDAHFEAELTDDGVLFRFVGFQELHNDEVHVPEWAKRHPRENGPMRAAFSATCRPPAEQRATKRVRGGRRERAS